MLLLIFYYLVLPFLVAGLVIKFIRRHGKKEVPENIALLFQEQPIERKWFRVLRQDHKGLRLLGDYETHADAVDSAYQGRQDAKTQSLRATFQVLNDKAEVLEEIDS